MNKSKKSLRSILMFWFVPFSIVPLLFVTGFSLQIYDEAINDELKKRLDGNVREIGVIFSDFEKHLQTFGRIHAADQNLVFDLTTGNLNRVSRVLEDWLKTYAANRISVFDEEGKLLLSTQKQGEGRVVSRINAANDDVYLSDDLLGKLKEQNQIVVRDHRPNQALELVAYTKISGKKGLLTGYLEEILPFDQAALLNLKKRFRLEIMLLDPQGKMTVASDQDLGLYPEEFFKQTLGPEKMGFVDMSVREEPYGFIVRPLPNTDSQVLVALGASKKDVKTVLRRITIALISVCGLVILLIIPTLLGISKMILRPLDYLVQAAHRIEEGESVSRIPVESTMELAVLTETFNRMSQKVTGARKDLEKKIKELEVANREIQQTQAQLVHTSKMVSLGQLVAGIAHELNNPIGFIYANMTHLKEYSEKLIGLIEVAEKNPAKLTAAKKDVEFDYIVEDLPKLIRSCEDGARRTRDIVVGLRNFSRLDEAKLKEVDLAEAIRNTLDLLTGELKTRVKVETDFAAVPKVKCYASQINQVLMNLLTNAAQAIDDEGIIRIKTWQDQDMVKLSIKDDGHGISKKNLEKIFDPFFTTKPVGQGTGLGLSISYGIVKKHGGEIDVISEQGKGTEFIVSLPINDLGAEVAMGS